MIKEYFLTYQIGYISLNVSLNLNNTIINQSKTRYDVLKFRDQVWCVIESEHHRFPKQRYDKKIFIKYKY